MNFFHHKDLGNHFLQLCPKVVKHPVYIKKNIHLQYYSRFVQDDPQEPDIFWMGSTQNCAEEK